jgi:hypothetical protein
MTPLCLVLARPDAHALRRVVWAHHVNLDIGLRISVMKPTRFGA